MIIPRKKRCYNFNGPKKNTFQSVPSDPMLVIPSRPIVRHHGVLLSKSFRSRPDTPLCRLFLTPDCAHKHEWWWLLICLSSCMAREFPGSWQHNEHKSISRLIFHTHARTHTHPSLVSHSEPQKTKYIVCLLCS